MKRIALLIYEDNLLPDDYNICKLLDFFGVPYQLVKSEDLSSIDLIEHPNTSDYCILSAATLMTKILGLPDESHKKLPPLIKRANSVYLYSIDNSLPCKQLLQYVTKDPDSEILPLDESDIFLIVAEDSPEICGPLSDMRVPIKPTNSDFIFRILNRCEGMKNLMIINNLTAFLNITKDDVTFFLSACNKVIDIDSPFEESFFDIKNYFLSAVPPVMYIKHAFHDSGWISSETGACLIVDDPLLKPRYGFFDYRKVLELMDSKGFTTNIAFIPVNWQRTNSLVAELFMERPDKYSISIHGCDHIAGEFGTDSISVLNGKTKLANNRMQLHQEKSGCHYDSIMVFPQGAFSKESVDVLKHNNFIAVANTEVAPVNSKASTIKTSEVWDLAIMKYGSFPIFTRRYPWHGIENFAFDILLGKPCLIVVHHDFFKNSSQELIEFIEKLNSLNCHLHWKSLGDVITSSFKFRVDLLGKTSLRLYAHKSIIENSFTESKTYLFEKQENGSNNIKSVEIDHKAVNWRYDEGFLRFDAFIPPKKKIDIRIVYDDIYGQDTYNVSTRYMFKTKLRRYMSEVRDNYLCKNDFLYSLASKVKRLVSTF